MNGRAERAKAEPVIPSPHLQAYRPGT
jgi:hypothetical protein